jgi:hypothetical protein
MERRVSPPGRHNLQSNLIYEIPSKWTGKQQRTRQQAMSKRQLRISARQ